jgi:hypothetical protein
MAKSESLVQSTVLVSARMLKELELHTKTLIIIIASTQVELL